MTTLEKQLEDKQAELSALEGERAELEARRELVSGRLTWLKSQAQGLRYQAQSDPKARAALATNEGEAAAVAGELETLEGPAAELVGKIDTARAGIARLLLNLRLRDFHQKRIEALAAYLEYHEAARMIEPQRRKATALQDEVTALSREFLSEKIYGCEVVAIPPMEPDKVPGYLTGEIEREKRVIAELVG